MRWALADSNMSLGIWPQETQTLTRMLLNTAGLLACTSHGVSKLCQTFGMLRVTPQGKAPKSWRCRLAARRSASRGGGRYPPSLGGGPEAGVGWGALSTAAWKGLGEDCGDRLPPFGALLATARTLASLVRLIRSAHTRQGVSAPLGEHVLGWRYPIRI